MLSSSIFLEMQNFHVLLAANSMSAYASCTKVRTSNAESDHAVHPCTNRLQMVFLVAST